MSFFFLLKQACLRCSTISEVKKECKKLEGNMVTVEVFNHTILPYYTKAPIYVICSNKRLVPEIAQFRRYGGDDKGYPNSCLNITVVGFLFRNFSAGLLQIFADLCRPAMDLCRPTHVSADLFRSAPYLFRSLQACSRSLQVSAGLL